MKDGSWGVRVYSLEGGGEPYKGKHYVTVHKKDGKTSNEEVDIFWVGQCFRENVPVGLSRLVGNETNPDSQPSRPLKSRDRLGRDRTDPFPRDESVPDTDVVWSAEEREKVEVPF